MSSRPAENFFIKTDGSFTSAAWYWPRNNTPNSTAVLIVPGIAHEEWAMSGGVAALAESIASAGFGALLIDLHGCSQSSGRLDEADISDRWREDIRAAVRHVRDGGFTNLIVIGIRLGALLAIEALRGEPMLGMVAWAPIVSGKRYIREMMVLQRSADFETGPGVALKIGGFDIPSPVLQHLTALDLAKMDSLEVSRLLLLDGAAGLKADWLTRLVKQGTVVERHDHHQIDDWLFRGLDKPPLPLDDIATVTDWCKRTHAEAAPASNVVPVKPNVSQSVAFIHKGQAIRETFMSIGPVGLTAVLTEPTGVPKRGTIRLIMNTVGPGRSFVDFARDDAGRGHACIRFDFAGFRTSARGGSPQGGELYGDAGGKDVVAMVDYLRKAGHDKINILGFCSGSWATLQAGPLPGIQAVAGINVQMFRMPGPQRDVFTRGIRLWLEKYIPALAKVASVRKIGEMIKGISGAKRAPVKWLERMCDAAVPTFLFYADDDAGLTYLRLQLEQGLQERQKHPFMLKIYKGLGHLLEAPVQRTEMFDDVVKFFETMDEKGAAQDRTAPLEAEASVRDFRPA